MSDHNSLPCLSGQDINKGPRKARQYLTGIDHAVINLVSSVSLLLAGETLSQVHTAT